MGRAVLGEGSLDGGWRCQSAAPHGQLPSVGKKGFILVCFPVCSMGASHSCATGVCCYDIL